MHGRLMSMTEKRMQDVDVLAEMCRRHGITHLKIDGIEISFGHPTGPHSKLAEQLRAQAEGTGPNPPQMAGVDAPLAETLMAEDHGAVCRCGHGEDYHNGGGCLEGCSEEACAPLLTANLKE